jgi:hypothetical protein
MIISTGMEKYSKTHNISLESNNLLEFHNMRLDKTEKRGTAAPFLVLAINKTESIKHY